VADTSGLEERLLLHATDAVDAAAQLMLDAMKNDMPVGKTHELVDSAGVDVATAESNDLVSVDIFVDADHAELVDEGTRPHDIVATQDHGLLVFDADDGTVFVSGKGGAPAVVHHPGTAPNPYFSQRMPERWPDLLQQALDSTVTA
jgi:hypothetical protein